MNKDNKELDLDFDFGGIFGDFTPEPTPEEKPDPEIPKAEEEEQEEPKPSKKKNPLEDEEVEEEIEEEKEIEEESSDNKEEEDEESVEYSYKAIANYLSEEGIIDFEDSEDLEDNPDTLAEAVHKTILNGIQEYKESIPEEAKLILEYLEKGGDINKYIQTLDKPLDLENINLEDENTQKKVLRTFLETQGYTSEEIKEEIKDYEDGLLLEKKAATAAKKLEKFYSKQKEDLIKAQEAYIAERQKQAEAYIAQVKSTIESADSLAGLKLSKVEKKDFERYLLAKDKEGLTAYQKELSENPLQTQLELAYLKFKKYDFSKVAAKAKTEETKRIRNLIKSSDKANKGKGATMPSKGDSKVDFSGFKEAFR